MEEAVAARVKAIPFGCAAVARDLRKTWCHKLEPADILNPPGIVCVDWSSSEQTVGKAMKSGKGTKIMKKPCGKGFKQRAVAGKKKRSPKLHFEATMDEIHEEWRGVVSYNKSFR